MTEQWIIFAILLAALVLFVGGWWRYDIVAMLALLAATVFGLVKADDAFAGFGHPAVITVAAVLVISRCLQNAGVIDPLARLLAKTGDNTVAQVASLTIIVTICSAFMNNVGALALLMPLAIQMARRSGRSPSLLLMPLAFGSLLGGLITLIGTPPNIIIATFRNSNGDQAYGMFDFAPVGLVAAGAGVAFIVLFGWRLIPQRQKASSGDELFSITEYLTEVRVKKDAKIAGKSIAELHRLTDAEAVVLGLVRNDRRLPAPSRAEVLREGDILIIEVDPEQLKTLCDQTGFELAADKKLESEVLGSEEVKIVEAVVSPGSMMVNRTVAQLNLRWRHGINLLAVARQGKRLRVQLRKIRFQPGDVLLLQGESATLNESLAALGCLPLAARDLRIGQPRRILISLAIFGTAIIATAIGLLPVQIAFAAAAVAMLIAGLLSLRDAYEAIDWPVIVLLGAMIPVGGALESTGGAALLAHGLLELKGHVAPVILVMILLIVSMLLSCVINNAAAVLLMAPIGIGLAEGLSASMDPFLMAVAVGASCPFLTPIGHQSNTLVLGPGGYQFGDYWRMGLPLSIVVIVVAVPAILFFWPL